MSKPISLTVILLIWAVLLPAAGSSFLVWPQPRWPPHQ